MFAAEYETAALDGRRRSSRAAVSFDVRLANGGNGRALCKVVDLSAHGARLHTYSTLRRGTTIWLALPDVGHVAADVMWADEFVAGCRFHVPLAAETFEALVARRS